MERQNKQFYHQNAQPKAKTFTLQSLSVWVEPALIVGLVLIALLVQGLNMFHYPTLGRLDDEGIYMSQAWAVLRTGHLTPYTYVYDHAPAGWILIAGWLGLVGGPNAFGSSLDTGRVFMLLLHLAMVPMLYTLARKFKISVAMSALGVLLFSVSPLAVTYQRAVLLDNVMMFWLLLSMNLLLDGRGRLSHIVLSGITYAIACLSKETAIFMLPAMIFLVFQQRWQHQGRFAVPSWLVPMVVVLSWYPLYALIKGALFPAGLAAGFTLLPSSISSHLFANKGGVSLTESLMWQGSRTGGSFFSLNSMFWQLMRTNWLPDDALLVVGGLLSIFINLGRGIRNRRALAVGLMGILPWIYLARGGVVYDFYIIFAIPFLILNLIMVLDWPIQRIVRTDLQQPMSAFMGGLVGFVFLFSYLLSGQMVPLFNSAPDQPYRQGLAWIEANIAPSSKMVIPDGIWTDLHEPGRGVQPFPYAESYWKVTSDPNVRNVIFGNSWQNVDFLILTPGMRQQLQTSGNTIAQQALDHATLVQRWQYGTTNFLEVWKVNKPTTTDQALLLDSNRYIKAHFGKNGVYADSNGLVTSENQAYAMLRSVWLNDKHEFYSTWGWTQSNLLKSNGLLAWEWQNGSVISSSSASDADTDAALALLFAAKRWNDPQLYQQGVAMVHAIRTYDVVMVKNQPYMTAGDWATAVGNTSNTIPLNPSYFSPYAYRIFNEVDPKTVWWNLISTSYQTIFDASSMSLGGGKSAGLPPNWIGLDATTGKLVPLVLKNKQTTTEYGYDASRTYWRIALDLQSTKDGRAQTFLNLAGFLNEEVTRKGYPDAVYTHTGNAVQKSPSMVGIAGAVSALLTKDPAMANQLYIAQILRGAEHPANGMAVWGNPNDLYTQEWAWFTIGLYSNQLPNLWWYIPPSP